MFSRAVILVVASFLIVGLIFGSYAKSDLLAKPIATSGISCVDLPGAFGHKVQCCQMFRDSTHMSLYQIRCTDCDNTNPPSNCGPVYTIRGGQPGTLLPPTNALPPPGNNTGTLPPGSIIKVPPGLIVNPTNASNSTGTPPPTLLKSSPSTTLAGQQPQTQQTSGHHHHKGDNQGTSTSTGSNSTGH